MTQATHPAAELGEEERFNYLTVVASLIGADGEIAEEEMASLLDLSASLDVGGEQLADRVELQPDGPKLRGLRLARQERGRAQTQPGTDERTTIDHAEYTLLT